MTRTIKCLARRSATVLARYFGSSARGSCAGAKVAICGGAGGIGQPLCLLLKQNQLIKSLSIYDIKGAPGVAADLSHLNTQPSIASSGDDINSALKGADIVVIPAGMPRKPGMTRDDLFNTNASICASIIDKVAANCPEARICIITNPVNSTVPIASEVLKYRKVYDASKLFGITTLDVVRANTFVSQLKAIPIDEVSVPVVAGHSGDTIVPLLSQTTPKCDFTQEEQEMLVKRIQNAGTEVVEAKAGAGSATLSMAFAASHFVDCLLRSMLVDSASCQKEEIIECTMTELEDKDQKNTGHPRFFSLPCVLGANGVKKRLEIGNLTESEKVLLDKAKGELLKNIQKGIEFGHNFCKQLKD